MILDDKDRNIIIGYRIQRAKETLSDVSFLIDHNKLIVAVNRIYYGAMFILSALALKYTQKAKTHQELIAWFNTNFIKNELIHKDYGAFLHKAYDKRSKADYSDYVAFDKKELILMGEELKDFIDKLIHLIDNEASLKIKID
jgi:uncharacterized protein (UPF0332 family)